MFGFSGPQLLRSTGAYFAKRALEVLKEIWEVNSYIHLKKS